MTTPLASAARDRIQIMDTYVSDIAAIAPSSTPSTSLAKSIYEIVHLLRLYLNLGELKRVSVKLSVATEELSSELPSGLASHSPAAHSSIPQSTSYFYLGDRSAFSQTQSKAHRILRQLHQTRPYDTVEEVAERILENRRITRTDQISLLNITLSHITLSSREKVLVDKLFDGLKLGILKVVD
jgi:hypothetical protein